MHDRVSNLILSGGSDGYVRLWSFAKINEAEADEDSNSTAITPLDELLIAPGRDYVAYILYPLYREGNRLKIPRGDDPSPDEGALNP